MTICGGFPVFRKIFVGGHLSKWIFAEGRSTRSPWCLEKNPRTHLEAQGSFGDEGTFQECQTSRISKIPLFGETENWRRGVYFDAEYVFAQFCHAKTAWITIWRKIYFLSENQVFSVFLFFDPTGSLFWPYRILSQEGGYSLLIQEFWQTDGGHQKFRFGLEAYSPSVLDWQTTIWRYFVMKLPSKNVKNHENWTFLT